MYMRMMKRVVSLFLMCLLLFSLIGCSTKSSSADSNTTNAQETEASTESADVYHTIGIAVYSSTDPMLSMFINYYQNYISASFPVEFLVSESLSSTEDEIAFIAEVKEQGGEGIISFFGQNLEQVVAACEEYEMYYVLGATSLSDDEYEAVKDNDWFLGVIGPDSDEEFTSGYEMAQAFIEGGATSFLIGSGGAGNGDNYMHVTRVCGMLSALEEAFDLSFEASIEELAEADALTYVSTGREDVVIVISPGYLDVENGVANLTQAFSQEDYDAFLAVAGVNAVQELLEEEIASSERVLFVGVIDCFSEENYDAVESIDANGNSLINYVKGRYASMVAPAFVALFNAMEGDLDVVKPDGEAFRLYQTYWTAESEAEFVELYSLTIGVIENAYSSEDLMHVIKAYNADATYEAFAELTQASDLESVYARLGLE